MGQKTALYQQVKYSINREKMRFLVIVTKENLIITFKIFCTNFRPTKNEACNVFLYFDIYRQRKKCGMKIAHFSSGLNYFAESLLSRDNR